MHLMSFALYDRVAFGVTGLQNKSLPTFGNWGRKSALMVFLLGVKIGQFGQMISF